MSEQACLLALFFVYGCLGDFCFVCYVAKLLDYVCLQGVDELFCKITDKIFGGYKKKNYFCIAIKDCAL